MEREERETAPIPFASGKFCAMKRALRLVDSSPTVRTKLPHASTFTSSVYCGEGPEDSPITNSEEIRYSLPFGLTVLDSSCKASAANRPNVSR